MQSTAENARLQPVLFISDAVTASICSHHGFTGSYICSSIFSPRRRPRRAYIGVIACAELSTGMGVLVPWHGHCLMTAPLQVQDAWISSVLCHFVPGRPFGNPCEYPLEATIEAPQAASA
jgi:hypothetical protein